MSVAGDEDVDIQLPLQHRQALRVAPRHHLVAVTQTNAELADRDDLLLRIVEVLGESKSLFIRKQVYIRCTGVY